MTRIGFYSGSFDPVTLGHTDVIRRAASLLDALVIGIGVNPGKAPMFPAAERVAMLEDEVRPLARLTKTKISVVTFSGLAVEAARVNGASVIIRGVRDGTDFDYEMQMAGMNGEMAPQFKRFTWRHLRRCATSRRTSSVRSFQWAAILRLSYRRTC